MIAFKILLIILLAAPAIALAVLLLSNLSGIVRKQDAAERVRTGKSDTGAGRPAKPGKARRSGNQRRSRRKHK